MREWVKLRERNEALDLEVYALAALHIMGPVLVRALPERAARFARTVGAAAGAAVEPVAARPRPSFVRPRRGGWMDGLS